MKIHWTAFKVALNVSCKSSHGHFKPRIRFRDLRRSASIIANTISAQRAKLLKLLSQNRQNSQFLSRLLSQNPRIRNSLFKTRVSNSHSQNRQFWPHKSWEKGSRFSRRFNMSASPHFNVFLQKNSQKEFPNISRSHLLLTKQCTKEIRAKKSKKMFFYQRILTTEKWTSVFCHFLTRLRIWRTEFGIFLWNSSKIRN